MVELKNAKANYEIRDLSIREEYDSYVLSWNYQKGNSFLVIVSSGKSNCELGKEIVSEIDVKWQELSQEEKCDFKGFKAFLVREPLFASQDKQFFLKKREVEFYLPARIQVVSCDQSEKISYIYKGRENGAMQYIPVPIFISYKYKKIWFSRNRRCFFRIEPVKDYQNGMLQYSISDQMIHIPLTEQCIGREMVVTMSKNAKMNLMVADKYKILYEVKERQ